MVEGRDLAQGSPRLTGIKGAKAGDIPVEQPKEFELVVNLKTAKALKISIPQSIMLRANRAIE